jgi:predicted nucleic-acid-binding protein
MGRASVNISVDTNVLVRSVVGDDKAQAAIANDALKNASAVAVAIPALCEFVWVLRKVYDLSPADIAAALLAA